MNDKRDFKKNLKYFKNGLGGVAEILGGIALSYPVTGCIGIPIIYDGIIRISNFIEKHEYTDSIITSKVLNEKDRRINQTIPNFKQMFEIGVEENKLEALVYQELKFLLNADRVNENNIPLNYNAKSQALTKRLLKQAERAGIITNFKSEKIDSKIIPFEKFIIGNINKNIFKKTNFFNIDFNITDKPITKDMIETFSKGLNIDLLDENKYNISYDDEGNIVGINLNKTKVFMSKFNKDNNVLLSGKDIKLLPKSNSDIEIQKDKSIKGNLFNNELKALTSDYEKIMNIKCDNNDYEIKQKKQIDTQTR